MRGAQMAMAIVMLAAPTRASAQSSLDLVALERDPSAYVAARYAAGDNTALRDDLTAAGFECRDAYPTESNLTAQCERMDQTSQHCFSFVTVRLSAGAAPLLTRAPRCMGVINPPARPSAQ